MMPHLPSTVTALSFVLCLATSFATPSAGPMAPGIAAAEQSFAVRGVVRETQPDRGMIVVRHEAISNYMAAMTMPFKVRDPRAIAAVQAGDAITFELHVTETESWVDDIVKVGTSRPVAPEAPAAQGPPPAAHPVWNYAFTNELGQEVTLSDFRGQALAITFFYTRCPLPDYCPRLSKNFEIASQRLAAMTGGPTNWHFVSISFDPTFDSPAMLKAYAESYHYDPAHWTFLTGSTDHIAALVRGAGLTCRVDGNTIDHDFRTLIVDTRGHLQTVFPTSGDLSDQVVAEMLKAAGTGRQ